MSQPVKPLPIQNMWKKRIRIQFFIMSFTLIAVICALVTPLTHFLKIWMFFGGIILGVLATLWNLRCPACHAFRGLSWFTQTCPKCNTKLTNTPN